MGERIDLKLSAEVAAELRQRLQLLLDARKDIDEQISAIHTVLGDKDQPLPCNPPPEEAYKPQPGEMPRTEFDVLDYMRHHKGVAIMGHLVREFNPAVVRTAVENLVERGLIRYTGRSGKYELTKQGRG